ncbi:hypothetical protein H920_03501 [Fukomys damarensis]|uniref:Uncharacterized protein n=1 Tax=Fukomys damarensis TaxID=885580 RepID=A0A091DXA2_FUKDA|nr:hypothetical protein H920_03501 [Fukomys damarensis]
MVKYTNRLRVLIRALVKQTQPLGFGGWDIAVPCGCATRVPWVCSCCMDAPASLLSVLWIIPSDVSAQSIGELVKPELGPSLIPHYHIQSSANPAALSFPISHSIYDVSGSTATSLAHALVLTALLLKGTAPSERGRDEVLQPAVEQGECSSVDTPGDTQRRPKRKADSPSPVVLRSEAEKVKQGGLSRLAVSRGCGRLATGSALTDPTPGSTDTAVGRGRPSPSRTVTGADGATVGSPALYSGRSALVP